MHSYPGLMIEKLPSGSLRCRIRSARDARKKTTIDCVPGDRDFARQYALARDGVSPKQMSVSDVKKFMPDVCAHIRQIIARSKSRSKTKDWGCELTEDDVIQIYLDQSGRCAVSKIEFDLSGPASGSRRPFCPSIDRIDNSKGYTLSNVRLTCLIVNTALADWQVNDFMQMCSSVVTNSASPSS